MAHLHNVIDTDTRFTIDPITRQIKNAGHKKVVLVQNDHNSEVFTFECPRTIEGHDMSLCNEVEIHYLNTESKGVNSKSGFYTVQDFGVDPEDESKVVCSWVIDRNATGLVGSLVFLVRYKCKEDKAITYDWHSEIYKEIRISDGINADERFEGDYVDVIDRWKDSVMAHFTAELAAWKARTVVEVKEEAFEEIATERKRIDLLSNYITPEMFGAKGDGVTDDTEAIQAALNNGVMDCLLVGKYAISQSLSINDGISVFSLDGAEIVALSHMQNMLHLHRTEINKPQTINVTLEGNGKAENGLYVAYCANLFIHNVRTRNMLNTHIHVADGYECFMSDIYCRNNLEYDANRTITGIIMDGTDSRIENAVVVNCNVGFELNESVHCTGIHPWNNNVDYIKDSIGVKCNAICFIDGSEIDTVGVGIQQLNYFQSYLTNTRFMFSKAVEDFTPVFVENNTRYVYCTGCIFGNIKQGKFILATKESLLVLNNCTFSDTPETDSKWANNTGVAAKYYQLVIANDNTGVVIPANGYSRFIFPINGVREFDAIHYNVVYDESGYLYYKVTSGTDKITVNVFNHHTDDITLRYSRLNVVLLRNNGDTLFSWINCNPN